jgi:uncharacterized protein (TIRG00374 family)
MQRIYKSLASVAHNKKLLVLVKLVFSATLLTVLFLMIDYQELVRAVTAANIFLLALGALFFTVNLSLLVFRWRLVLRQLQIRESLSTLYSLNIAGTFYNHFLPSSIGGDGYKFLVLAQKYGEQKMSIVASLFADRMNGLFVLLVANIVLLPLFVWSFMKEPFFVVTELLIVLTTLALVSLGIFLKKKGTFHSTTVLSQKVQDLMQYSTGLTKMRVVLPMSGYSLAFIMSGALWLWVYLLAFGVSVHFLYVLFVFTIAQIAGMVPISFNSMGVAEGILVFFLAFALVPPEVVLLAALTQRTMLMALSATGWVLVSSRSLLVR